MAGVLCISSQAEIQEGVGSWADRSSQLIYILIVIIIVINMGIDTIVIVIAVIIL
jgi:hypothetical protein